MRTLRMTLRLRLTLFYLSLLFCALIVYLACASIFLLHNLFLQLDLTINRDIVAVERTMAVGADGSIWLGADIPGNSLIEIWSPDGTLLYRSEALHGQALGSPPSRNDIQPRPRPTCLTEWKSYSQCSIRLANGMRIRTALGYFQLNDKPLIVRLGISEGFLWHELSEMSEVLIYGLPLILAVVGVTGYFVAKRALAPVASMACRAKAINAERLNERLQIANPDDELGHLGLAFNETLSRLERSFEQLKRFTADASHELRTPLTAMRTVGEVALQQPRSAEEYRETIGSMLEDSNRLANLVDTLLTLSRADAGQILLHPFELTLISLARESAALLEVLAEEKDQSISVTGDESVHVLGDRLILRQAVVALLDNAVKFSPTRAVIHVRVGSNGSGAFVEVQNSAREYPKSIAPKSLNASTVSITRKLVIAKAAVWDSPLHRGPWKRTEAKSNWNPRQVQDAHFGFACPVRSVDCRRVRGAQNVRLFASAPGFPSMDRSAVPVCKTCISLTTELSNASGTKLA